MSAPKLIFTLSLGVCLIVGLMAIFKKRPSDSGEIAQAVQSEEIAAVERVENTPEETRIIPFEEEEKNVDRVWQLFTTSQSKLPIVETISYASRVPWLKGRPAWITDYASHYSTSRHFIARSLNGKADYYSQKVSTGDRFNVFRSDKNINFYLVIDIERCKMRFYYLDLDTNERVLLKTYPVGLGRIEPMSISGTLTPSGKYMLGQKVAIYKPGMTGFFQNQETEMIQIFGTRWIPFDQEISGCISAPKGYGLHGVPWTVDSETEELKENRDCIGTYDSDGCIRLYQEDIEELFSIVITKPTIVEVVKRFEDADLPGFDPQEENLQAVNE